jgi:integrase
VHARRPYRTPSYRLHKPSGRAVVTIDGRDYYLGVHGSNESWAEYDRIIAEWLANGRRVSNAPVQAASDLSVNELLLAYLEFAEGYYRKRGVMTREVENIRLSIRPLRRLYGDTAAASFGPLALKSVRKCMIDSGLCRNEVNKRIGRIVRVFKWSVENELVLPAVHHGLSAVSGLRRGRAEVRESKPVKPVPIAHVAAVRPFVSRQVWAMIELQSLTGMRPGEVCSMRSGDLETSATVWFYRPDSHKMEHRGRDRVIVLGPRAQEVIRPWLRSESELALFSPREATEERRAEARRRRKTKVQPSQECRAKRKPRRGAGMCYTPMTYRNAVAYGCTRANVPHWHPNQLRHNAATLLRRDFGLDTARAVLGHSSTAVTELYAELDRSKAAEAMERIG